MKLHVDTVQLRTYFALKTCILTEHSEDLHKVYLYELSTHFITLFYMPTVYAHMNICLYMCVSWVHQDWVRMLCYSGVPKALPQGRMHSLIAGQLTVGFTVLARPGDSPGLREHLRNVCGY